MKSLYCLQVFGNISIHVHMRRYPLMIIEFYQISNYCEIHQKPIFTPEKAK